MVPPMLSLQFPNSGFIKNLRLLAVNLSDTISIPVRGTMSLTILNGFFMASVATASSFVGAAIPLSVAVLFPRLIYLPLVAANMTLMGVGLTLGLWVQGARWKWALGLMGIGDILALLGYKVGLS